MMILNPKSALATKGGKLWKQQTPAMFLPPFFLITPLMILRMIEKKSIQLSPKFDNGISNY
jgi:hypothetical protein